MAKNESEYVIETLEKWQRDKTHRTSGVFVIYFNITPQMDGFLIGLDIHVPGEVENMAYESIHGSTLYECVDKAAEAVEKYRRKLLEELKN
jgi:hypothetical protein